VQPSAHAEDAARHIVTAPMLFCQHSQEAAERPGVDTLINGAL
jgi:hypothetical protein